MKRLVLLLALAGCDERIAAPVTGLQSFAVTVTAPDNLGAPDAPVTVKDITYDVRAIDAQGNTFAEDVQVDVYLSFAGNKIGTFTNCGDNEDSTPLETITLKSGVLQGHVTHLPRAFGRTTVWLEETPEKRAPMNPGTYALGSTPPIYFPNPTIPDVQTPLDLAAPTATYCTPWNGKHVVIDHATGAGKLVVTSVFIDSYVVADTGANFDPMTGMGGFNHLYIFSFGHPPAGIQPGRIIANVSGNVSKFVGFTELNFPLQDFPDTVDPQLLPPVYVLSPGDRGNNLRLIRLAGATVSVSGTICPIDVTSSDWLKFNQFVVNQGQGLCDSFNGISVSLPAKTLGTFDPLQHMGGKITAVGMLRNFSGQNDVTAPPTDCTKDMDCMTVGGTCVEGSCKKGAFNFWQVTPRDQTDLTVN